MYRYQLYRNRLLEVQVGELVGTDSLATIVIVAGIGVVAVEFGSSGL